MRSTLGVNFAVVGLSACSVPLGQCPDPDANLDFTLDAIDDRPLPFAQLYGTSPSRQEVFSGMLLLRRNGTFLMDLTYFTANPDGPSRSSRVWDGTWRRSGNTFYFEFDNGGRSNAVLRDGPLRDELESAARRRIAFRRLKHDLLRFSISDLDRIDNPFARIRRDG